MCMCMCMCMFIMRMCMGVHACTCLCPACAASASCRCINLSRPKCARAGAAIESTTMSEAGCWSISVSRVGRQCSYSSQLAGCTTHTRAASSSGSTAGAPCETSIRNSCTSLAGWKERSLSTYSTRAAEPLPSTSARAASARHSCVLPMPAGPTTSVTPPARSPPPRCASSAGRPVRSGRGPAALLCKSWSAVRGCGATAAATASSTSSTSSR